MRAQRSITHSLESSQLADVLERLLDKGIVIAGDIKVKLVDVELLTVQIRLVICSVDKAVEMGMNWWASDPNLCTLGRNNRQTQENEELQSRVAWLEKTVRTMQPSI